jgi:hypothetical protein
MIHIFKECLRQLAEHGEIDYDSIGIARHTSEFNSIKNWKQRNLPRGLWYAHHPMDPEYKLLAEKFLDGRLDSSEIAFQRRWAKHPQRDELFKRLSQLSESEMLAKVGLTGIHRTSADCRILVFDIETAPIRAFIWSVWMAKIGYNMDMLSQDWYMICWAAKWLFDDKLISDVQTPEEAKNNDDSRICKTLHALIDEADIVIAHNGDKFDLRKIRTRFTMNGLPPNTPYQSIDTLKAVRKKFSFSSNRLDYISRELGFGGKLKTDWSLWERCYEGDPEALQKMDEYCCVDVQRLEDVYLYVRPWIQPHPNIGLWHKKDERVCCYCAHDDLEPRGTYATSANLFDCFVCKNCNGINRAWKSSIPTDKKRFLLRSVAR